MSREKTVASNGGDCTISPNQCLCKVLEAPIYACEHRKRLNLTGILLSWLLAHFFSSWFRAGRAAVQGRGEDERAGRLLLWENLQRQGGRLQGGRGLDRWLQELHMHGGTSQFDICVRVCAPLYNSNCGTFSPIKWGPFFLVSDFSPIK